MSTAIAAPAALSLITTAFPEGPLRARALGLNGAVTAAGFTCGALLGGLLTGLWSWRWAFLVNVPVALVILVAVRRLVPEGRDGRTTRLDLPGAITVTSGLPGHEQGLATGLSAMAQQVGMTVGTPLLSTVATAPAGVRPAIGVNAATTLAAALLVLLLGRTGRRVSGPPPGDRRRR